MKSFRIFKSSIFFIIYVLIFICYSGCKTVPPNETISFSKKEKRFIEENGGFSLLLSESWLITEHQNLKYKLLINRQNGQTLLLYFDIMSFIGEINEFVDDVADNFDLLFDEGNFLQRKDFITHNNLKGERVTATVIVGEEGNRFLIYILPGEHNKKLIAFCIVDISVEDIFDSLFDSIMETFKWE